MGLYEFMFGEGTENDPAPDTMFGFTEEGLQQESKKYAADMYAPEITWKDVGNVALDFTPIIGDIKGGYETVKMIGEELDKENPNYYLIGAMGGLGAVATIVGLVPGAGDAASKAIMSGARSIADGAGKVADALPKYDPNTVGSLGGNMFVDSTPTVKQTEEGFGRRRSRTSST